MGYPLAGVPPPPGMGTPWPGLMGSTWGGVPPGQVWGSTQGGVPPDRVPPPLARSDRGYLRWGTSPAGPGQGTLPPVDRQIDGWMDRHVWKHYLPVVLRTRSIKINYRWRCSRKKSFSIYVHHFKSATFLVPFKTTMEYHGTTVLRFFNCS